jgi:hypothetical protein
VALWWESGGDELAWSDGAHSGAGQLEHWSWLEYVRQGMIHGWLVEYEIQLGSSDAPASHALVVDRQSAIAYVAPMALARRIIRAQALGERRWPSEGRAVFGVDEAAAGVLRMRRCWGKPRSSRTRPIQFDVLDDLASGS